VTFPEHVELLSRYGMHIEQFSDLMAHRVGEILLVAAEYDAFMLEEDGQLTELVLQRYRDLDLTQRYPPRFTRVASGAQALELLGTKTFDLVITTARISDMELSTFGRRVREVPGAPPVGVLVVHAWELPGLVEAGDAVCVDWIFLWQGDVRSLFALITQIEDRRNADHDVLKGGVQAIILVDDDVRFCSFFLPHLYEEVTQQTARLLAEGLNLSHRLLRMRARPKVLLARDYDEAWALFERYRGNILGVITDVSYPRGGRIEAEAGLQLVQAVRAAGSDVPILVQSTEDTVKDRVTELHATFVSKLSPTLVDELRSHLLDSFGFGDFVFRTPDRAELSRAPDLRALLAQVSRVSDASLQYHAERNHFSRWLKARTEFELAAMVRMRRFSDFPSSTGLRQYLVDVLTGYLREIQRHVITDFSVEGYDDFAAFAKIGAGSLGGKGRGLAFMHKLLAQDRLDLPEVECTIPQTAVVASDVFEQYLETNKIHPQDLGIEKLSDREIVDVFRRGRFPRERRAQLAAFLRVVTDPIAVRSSSILEDSLYQPFAGVYATLMLPNNHPSPDVRLAQLIEAIKMVYASTYMRGARLYFESTQHRPDEERMAVLLQRLVGGRHGRHMYPTLAGVACSRNFYPFGAAGPTDGVAHVALGLGRSVVEGLEALRFSPAYPRVLPQMSTTSDMLKNAQRRFFALDLGRDDIIPGLPFEANVVQLSVVDAIADGAANAIASTYLPQNDRVVPGLIQNGTPLMTFAPLLSGGGFPLPEVLVRVLRAAEEAMGVAVEIEFALELAHDAPGKQPFHILQVRPMMVASVDRSVTIAPESVGSAVVFAERAMGHGRATDISDVVVVAAGLDRARTGDVAAAVERYNRVLREASRPYVLIGPGRWGSRDPWLGIPVSWPQVSGARAIVETDFVDLQVEPSQGSHFFHNLSALGVSFFSVPTNSEGHIDWAWLEAQPAASQELDGLVRHIRLPSPLEVVVDGTVGRGIIRAGGRGGHP
jgi:DNA-binding response OmpR family regulator